MDNSIFQQNEFIKKFLKVKKTAMKRCCEKKLIIKSTYISSLENNKQNFKFFLSLSKNWNSLFALKI